MKKLILSCFFVFLLFEIGFPQRLTNSTLPNNWKRIYIKNVGNFDLPPTMEIQSGLYKEFSDESRKIRGYDAPTIIAQQKGLNDFGKEGFAKYSRVILETDIGTSGAYEKLNFDFSTIPQSEIAKLSNTYKEQYKQSFINTDFKIIEWFPLKIEKINGMSCIHICYKRQLSNNPLVIVNTYIFQNYDRMHTLTLSYRISETDYWKDDFALILKSFRITNIK